jgi:AdoMet-dependent heme synthase
MSQSPHSEGHPHGGGHPGGHPGSGRPDGYTPRLIAWELTRSCTLSCKHCRAAAERGPYKGELSLDEIKRVIDNVAANFKPIMILTGGEPLLRPDIYEIAQYCTEQGLRPVLATCGTTLTVEVATKLKESGVERISVSIDGPNAEAHDNFRGVPGAFEGSMRGLKAANEAGLEFQINTTVTKINMDDVEEILNLAVSLGAVAFHPFLLVPTGRGEGLKDKLLTPGEYERVLNKIYKLRDTTPIHFKPTCAPHYYRILRQKEAAQGREVTPETHGLDAMSKGCMGGNSFAFISHTGKVQICGFLEAEAGDVRAADYDFASIWKDSLLFNELRDHANYKGDCGVCKYIRWCGGCRARSYAMTGDYLTEEPYCAYVPEENRGKTK